MQKVSPNTICLWLIFLLIMKIEGDDYEENITFRGDADNEVCLIIMLQ